MITLLIALGAGVGFVIAYHTYGRWLGTRVFNLAANVVCPSQRLRDDRDYVPTSKAVVFGHHFTSIAGTGPIVGPAIAVMWGWLPALLWVVFGSIFIGAVHDFGALVVSLRNNGQTVGDVAGRVLNRRVRLLFLFILFMALTVVLAIFGLVIAAVFRMYPAAIFPCLVQIPIAIVIGVRLHRRHVGLLVPSIIALGIMYLTVIYGNEGMLHTINQSMAGWPLIIWVGVLLVYSYIASVLPVWMLLQPRDYINGLQLFIGLIILYGALALLNPDIVAPGFNSDVPAGTPSLFPLLFVTIACGAISGFHGLVSSGTTSKQLDRETDVRFVGYFGAVGEGMLALGSILAATAGFATLGDWQAMYDAFGKGGVNAFVEGGAFIIHNGIGLPQATAATLLTVMAALFAGTTMDTGLRLQRYIFQEWGEIYDQPWMKKPAVATLLAVLSCLVLAFGAGADGSGGLIIWPLFGTTNQLLAGLTLLVVTVMLMRNHRPVYYTLIPLVFLLIVTVLALLAQLKSFFVAGNYFLLALDIVVLIASVLVAMECASALKRLRHEVRGETP